MPSAPYMESRAVSASVRKVMPSAPWYGMSRRIHRSREELCLSRAFSASVWKVAPSPFWSEKLHQLRLGLESHAVSTLVWKVAPYPTRSRGLFSLSRPLRPGLEIRAVSTLVWTISTLIAKVHRGCKDTFLVAPYLSRSGKPRDLHLVLKKTADSALVWKVRPSPPWYEGSRRIHGGHKECFLCRAVSAWVWKVMPSPPWYGKSHRIHSGCGKIFLGRAVSALVWKVAPSPPSLEESRHFCLGLKRRGVSSLVTRI